MLRELEDGNLGMSAELGSTGKITERLRRPSLGTSPKQEQGGRPWEALRRASTAAAGGVLNPALVGEPHRGVRVLGTARSAGARTFARKLKQAGPGLGYRSPQLGVLQLQPRALFVLAEAMQTYAWQKELFDVGICVHACPKLHATQLQATYPCVLKLWHRELNARSNLVSP